MINPADPSKPAGGDGNEKYNPPQKRGPGEFDKTLEEAKKRFKEIAEEGRKQGDIKKQYWDINPPKGGGGGAMPKSNRDITKNYAKGGKVKRYNGGGISLEEQYPGAKITRVSPNEPPGKSEKFKEIEADHKKSIPQTSGSRVTEPKFTDSGDTQGLEKVGRGRVSRGGGAAPIPKAGRHEMLKFKSGGKVSSASKRADGIAIRGRTRI